MAAARRLAVAALMVCALVPARALEPSWTAELRQRRGEEEACTTGAPPSSARGAHGRRSRRRRKSWLQMFGIVPGDGEEAPAFKLPKLSVGDALIGVFVVMIGGILLGGQI